MNSMPRSRNSMLDIVNRIENGENLSIDEAKGVKGRSLLFDIPEFDFIYDSPTEYLHLGCLGVVKKLVQLTFAVGENKPRITTRKLSSPALFNRLIQKIKVTNEFSRRVRDLDFATFKAQEYRNLCLFFFPLVIECIEENEKERNLWLYLAYLLRSCVIPSQEFRPLNVDVINSYCEKFYVLFESLFGARNCTYSFHVFFVTYWK